MPCLGQGCPNFLTSDQMSYYFLGFYWLWILSSGPTKSLCLYVSDTCHQRKFVYCPDSSGSDTVDEVAVHFLQHFFPAPGEEPSYCSLLGPVIWTVSINRTQLALGVSNSRYSWNVRRGNSRALKWDSLTKHHSDSTTTILWSQIWPSTSLFISKLNTIISALLYWRKLNSNKTLIDRDHTTSLNRYYDAETILYTFGSIVPLWATCGHWCYMWRISKSHWSVKFGWFIG
jgi:hypothetical protein